MDYQLNELEQQFADEYIVNGRNATQAYKHIRPNVKDTTAATKGLEWVRKSKISLYIKDKTEARLNASNLTSDNIIDRLIDMGFGRTRKGYSKKTDLISGEVVKEIEYEHTAQDEEQIKALELLGKSMAMWTDKQEISAKITPVFVDDISDIGSDLHDN